MIECSMWKDCGVNGGGCCTANHYSRPSFGVCLRICKHYDGPKVDLPKPEPAKGCCGDPPQKWFWFWYVGLPYPMRIWRWLTWPTHARSPACRASACPKPSSWKGCGCLLYWKTVWAAHRRVRAYVKKMDDDRSKLPLAE